MLKKQQCNKTGSIHDGSIHLHFPPFETHLMTLLQQLVTWSVFFTVSSRQNYHFFTASELNIVTADKNGANKVTRSSADVHLFQPRLISLAAWQMITFLIDNRNKSAPSVSEEAAFIHRNMFCSLVLLQVQLRIKIPDS